MPKVKVPFFFSKSYMYLLEYDGQYYLAVVCKKVKSTFFGRSALLFEVNTCCILLCLCI